MFARHGDGPSLRGTNRIESRGLVQHQRSSRGVPRRTVAEALWAICSNPCVAPWADKEPAMSRQSRKLVHPDITPENPSERAAHYVDVPNMPWEASKFPGIKIKL